VGNATCNRAAATALLFALLLGGIEVRFSTAVMTAEKWEMLPPTPAATALLVALLVGGIEVAF